MGLILISLVSMANGALAEALSGETLIAALRKGGHILYFRHAQTNWSQYDQIRQAGDWLSCDPAEIRQLSDEGRDTARGVGVRTEKPVEN